MNGYSGTVSLTIAVLPDGLTTSVNPASVALTSGGSGASTLTVSTTASTPATSYTVQVTGSDGTLSHSVTITITVTSDFSLITSPTSLTILQDNSATFALTLSSLGGFAGTVSLTAAVSPIVTNGPTVSLNPTSVTLSSGGSGTSTLTITTNSSTPRSTYAVTVMGSSGSLSHSATISLAVTSDFGITASPTTLTINGGTTGSSTVTVTSLGGFAGTVSVSVVSTGPSVAVVPSSIVLSSTSTSGAVTLTISVSNIASGGYTVTATGTSGSLAHSVLISVTVPFPSDPLFPNQWGLPDLNLPQGWQQRTVGTRNRVIAVIDSGVDFFQPDLQTIFWTAQGFADVPNGSHGWDFVHANNNPADDYGHGTAVTGVIAAVIDDGYGVAGTAREQIMVIKSWNAAGGSMESWLTTGIQWAVNHGANVINMSWEWADTTALHDAVNYAWNHGAVLVAGAGNSGGSTPVFPAAYFHVEAVVALQLGDTKAGFSNSGGTVAAPGVGIWTTCWQGSTAILACTGNLYASLDGTSFAAPFISGIAALIWDYNIQQGRAVLSNLAVNWAVNWYATNLGVTLALWGKPNALSSLNNVVTTHSYTLAATWSAFRKGGVEPLAHVSVYDFTTATQLLNNVQVGNAGVVISIMAGDDAQVTFEPGPFCDPSVGKMVFVEMTGSGGAPTHPAFTTSSNTERFAFPATPASNGGLYGSTGGC